MKNNIKLARQFVAAAITAVGFLASTNAVLAVESADPRLRGTFEAELRVLGPVETINVSAGYLIVAGQRVPILGATTLLDNGVVAADRMHALQSLQSGDLVAVNGLIDGPTVSVNKLAESYVPGATIIFVRGRVDSVDASVGIATVSGLRIDFTPAMGSSGFAGIDEGEVIEASGIQPAISGSLLAASITSTSIRSNANTGTSVHADAITGTSFRPGAITGTSRVDAITGTSFRPGAITGTSRVDAITGTSFRPGAITGTSRVDAITGTSFRPGAITGTSHVDAITGTSFRPKTGR